MARVYEVKKARKAFPEADIKAGDKYYWWKFNFSRTIHRSLTYPKRSQLTQSSFLAQLWDIQDGFTFDRNDPEGCVGALRDDLENLKSECEGNLENMPEGLRESSDSGQTLQERIDQLDEWINNLDGINIDLDSDCYNKKADREARLDELEQEVQDADPGM